MRNYWRARGSRRAVRQFSRREGLWVVAIVSVALIAMILLFKYINLDTH
jgi:uncharacterized integral membrane protein